MVANATVAELVQGNDFKRPISLFDNSTTSHLSPLTSDLWRTHAPFIISTWWQVQSTPRPPRLEHRLCGSCEALLERNTRLCLLRTRLSYTSSSSSAITNTHRPQLSTLGWHHLPSYPPLSHTDIIHSIDASRPWVPHHASRACCEALAPHLHQSWL